MAAFALPIVPIPLSSCHKSLAPVKQVRMSAAASSKKRSVVWIRHGDMRTVDHGGLAGVTYADAAVAVFVPRPDSDPEVVLSLANALEETRGIRLYILAAQSEAEAIVKFAGEFRATEIHVQKDETEESRAVLHQLEQSIGDGLSIRTWIDSFREFNEAKLSHIPYEYPAFLRWGERNYSPLLTTNANATLPFPSAEEHLPYPTVKQYRAGISGSKDNRTSPLYHKFLEQYTRDSVLSNSISVHRASLGADSFGERILEQFLDDADAYRNPDMARSLQPIFAAGLLSSRRICELVIKRERENGRIFRPIFREGAKEVLNYLDAREFALLLAREDLKKGATVDGVHRARFWRWRGYLIRYVDEEPPDGLADGKPSLLLIHGFGASSQHFGRSISILKKNFRVLALDILGYGRSEKPPTAFTPDLTECVIWEFVREVVGAPVYIAGNSIGGYFSAAFAADAFPELCAGVALINSAGKLEDPAADASATTKRKGPLDSLFGLGKYVLEEWKPARMLAANFLLRNLRGRIGTTLKSVYPTKPDNADEQLAGEIYRNSLDFGADSVLASGLVLPSPRTLSALLEKYSGPLLIYQGTLDPLNSAGDRGEKIQTAYPRATLVPRQLGYVSILFFRGLAPRFSSTYFLRRMLTFPLTFGRHCPHDEDPEHFSETISEWMHTENTRSAAAKFPLEGEAKVLQN